MNPHKNCFIYISLCGATPTKKKILNSLLDFGRYKIVLGLDARHKDTWHILGDILDKVETHTIDPETLFSKYGKKIENFNGRWPDNFAKLGFYDYFFHSSFEYGWYMEDDVYAKSWCDFFLKYESIDRDIIYNYTDELPFWLKSKDFDRVGDESHICRDVPQSYCTLCCHRMSKNFCINLINNLKKEPFSSHHELYIPYISNKYNHSHILFDDYDQPNLINNPCPIGSGNPNMNHFIKDQDCNIFHPVKNLEDLPKAAFFIRGHVRGSLEDRVLNDFLIECSTIIDFDLYIQTWNVSETNKSWRDTSTFEFNKVTESNIFSYLDDSLHCKIKSLLVLDDSKVELIGDTEGFIGKTCCPKIGWKNMWAGMYQNVSQVPENHSYKFAINTRFDILSKNLDDFCRRPSFTKNFYPRTHLDFIKQMIVLSKFRQLNTIYSLYDIVGCDNFIAGDIKDIKWLIKKFHFELDDIIPKWVDSNFRVKHQEACVRWFCKMNNMFRFNGLPINLDEPSKEERAQ